MSRQFQAQSQAGAILCRNPRPCGDRHFNQDLGHHHRLRLLRVIRLLSRPSSQLIGSCGEVPER